MVMDLVYICRKGDNEELRYSIRSAQENFVYDNIWVIGGKPDWYRGDYVNVPDQKNKFDSIINCTKIIPDIGAISDDFVLMNDDFFFLKKLGKMPVYHGGLLRDKIDQYTELGARRYATFLEKTYKGLVRNGIKNPLDYDLHVPMPMNKLKLKESVKKAYFPRSGYGNIHDIGGELITDVKTYSTRNKLTSRSYDFSLEDSAFISTEDDSFSYVYESILKDRFTKPSIQESV
jgi:hypothetical protein